MAMLTSIGAVSVIMKAIVGLVVAVLYFSQRVSAEGNRNLSLSMAFRMPLLIECMCGYDMSVP